ncbi:LOW QUALITY PROTEIN: U-box domain-containing protein 35-like [Arachis duranensis]|uniref:RING-type E3 ubiquitin transferase n=1 Tax=Arachis duranensis TaxID=130453 RepID=A0A6P5MYT2_ARADU|nr:LOW QUALITY PROTEIN: U-box domain-containing protein 35-like [Arachis duranensis]
MWLPRSQQEKDGVNGLVAVAGSTVILIHVKINSNSAPSFTPRSLTGFITGKESIGREPDAQNKSIFLPYRVFCTRKDIQCKDVLIEDVDVAKAIVEYATQAGIEHLVLGSSSKTGLLKRFKVSDIPGSVTKGAPDFCTVYVVSKGKIQSMRSASRPAPPSVVQLSSEQTNSQVQMPPGWREHERFSYEGTPHRSQEGTTEFRSPFTRKGYHDRYTEHSAPDLDISFVSNGRPSSERMVPSFYTAETTTSYSNPRFSYSSEPDTNYSFESVPQRRSFYLFYKDDIEAEMRRLRLELKQTMEMYNTACKEALTAQQKAVELQRWKLEEEKKLEEARLAEEAALAIAENEKARSRAALEAAEAQKRIAELEAQKRLNAEMKAIKEAEEKKKAIDALSHLDIRYRKYSIEEIEAATEFFKESLKIGEGGYGPVYKCCLDHTPVAVKVLRPDAAQGRAQFQREVEILSCIRHPNMVLLLGACPEYGCLVYEYLSQGSLEDRLFRRGNTPSLSWQIRFKIAAEIGTGLLFLHQTKPEPLVHRDLKPANILLNSNFGAKISDVGLARLVPPSVADSVTQYHMTSAAGTFCYIDPEYQQTGMLGVKSDIYSLGVIFLQILTARPPMGLAHSVERSIEKGTFAQMLDPTVPDWPIEEAMSFAKLAIRCAELRRKDRPDLAKEILPELNRLRDLAYKDNPFFAVGNSLDAPSEGQVSLNMDSGPSS